LGGDHRPAERPRAGDHNERCARGPGCAWGQPDLSSTTHCFASLTRRRAMTRKLGPGAPWYLRRSFRCDNLGNQSRVGKGRSTAVSLGSSRCWVSNSPFSLIAVWTTMGVASILPDCSVAEAVSCRCKSGAGVVAAYSEEGGLPRVGSSSPAERSDECPAKTVYRARPREAPDPAKPPGPDPAKPPAASLLRTTASTAITSSSGYELPLSVRTER
jgi:hypothetical protein